MHEKRASTTSKKSYTENVEQSDFEKHIERLKHVKSKLNDKVGKVNVANLMKLGRVLHDLEGYNKIHKLNFRMLRSLNEIKYAYLAEKNKFKPHGFTAAEVSTLASPTFRYRALQLKRENKKFAARLEAISQRTPVVAFKIKSKAYTCQIGKFKLPEKILAKYDDKVEIPQDSCLQFKLFRPRIFIDVEARNERPIGRINFQLYTEACPMIVLELVKVFMTKQNAKMKFSRIYPNLWAECEISIDNRNFDLPGLEYDMRALDHGSNLGIISVDVKRQSLRYLRHGLLVVAISFKPVPILNGRRVAIGRITNGRRNLTGLSEYGTKNGKPLKNIVVTQLGIVDS